VAVAFYKNFNAVVVCFNQ